MWSYLHYILYSYLLLYDSQASLVTPLQTTLSPENPCSLWEDIKEVTHDLIEASNRDGGPKTLFQPTSFLNPGYGVLFQHIGKLHQSVYKHYLIIGMKIPTLQHMPEQPEEWYQGCEDGVPLLHKTYEDFTFKHMSQDPTFLHLVGLLYRSSRPMRWAHHPDIYSRRLGRLPSTVAILGTTPAGWPQLCGHAHA